MKAKAYADEEFAELLGVFLGDGWIESRGTALYIAGSPLDDKHYYDAYLADLFSRVFVPVKPRLFPYWGVYGIVTYKGAIVRKAVSMGFCPGDKAKTVHLSEKILSSQNNCLFKGILRGVFDADGCFWCVKRKNPNASSWSKKHNCLPRVVFTTSSQKFSTQLSYLLNSLDIHNTVTVSGAKFVCNRNNSAFYRVWINKQSDINKFFKVIGTKNLKHISRYLVWKLYGHLPSKTTLNQRLLMISKAVFSRESLAS